MLLIADSGSTKTDWRLIGEDKKPQEIQTVGFNPYLQSGEEIYATLLSFFNNLPLKNISKVFFYGAGCSNKEMCGIVTTALARLYPNAHIEVEHDLLAAARALCGRNEGIAAILGTGSNSCLYDGNEITEHIDSIGFFLGDEGSGGYMGKKLVRAFIYKELPAELENHFVAELNYDKDAILKAVYQQPFPNRFLASFSLFIDKHRKHPFINEIIVSSFSDFFEHHITKYSKHRSVPMHCTGSIGFYYNDILRSVAKRYGVEIGRNIKSPIEGLVDYHLI